MLKSYFLAHISTQTNFFAQNTFFKKTRGVTTGYLTPVLLVGELIQLTESLLRNPYCTYICKVLQVLTPFGCLLAVSLKIQNSLVGCFSFSDSPAQPLLIDWFVLILLIAQKEGS